jgi:hypothetical protein
VFGRIEIGTQFMPRNSAGRFDLENALRWNALFLDPFLYGLSAYLEFLSERFRATCGFNGSFNRIHG